MRTMNREKNGKWGVWALWFCLAVAVLLLVSYVLGR